MFKKIFLILSITALMAGCGSSVKLDDVPVEDRKTDSSLSTDGNADGSTITPLHVTPGQLDELGPVGQPHLIYFDYDSYIVKPEFQTVLESHARFLKEDSQRKLMIEGHTDARGGREYNLALGQKRAEAVARSLALLGVSDNQVESVSFGKEKPADEGLNEVAMSKNRRAQLSYRK